jgi:2-oxoisovalerate dehydrogenase E1 component
MSRNQHLYRLLYTIRRFEETVLENFSKGVFSGTTHTYLGQEANAVGVLSHLQPGDVVFSNHRGHGHFIAYGGDLRALFAEMMGKQTGVCGGRGGSQHLHWRDFYSNGVQGGIVPVATGMALAEKRKDTGAVTVCFLGDGTLGEGVVYEAFNLASLWDAPLLYVVENNHIAQTTPVEKVLAGNMDLRFAAFGIPVIELDSSDVLEISALAKTVLEDVRSQGKPYGLVIHTHRFGPHSKGDDTRDPEWVADLREKRDPIKIHAARLDTKERAEIEKEVDSQVAEAFQKALSDPLPVICDQLSVFSNQLSADGLPSSILRPPSIECYPQSVLQSLNSALHQALETDENVILLGEDILDPYGGAFKVTSGLSDAFPERVLTTPISEAGIVGAAAGMALRGLRPVVEIMFGDFVTLIADQVINHIAKFRWMYNDQVHVPLVIRTPMGGRRGYGPTHSQTIEKLFLGVPGLRVLAPCALQVSKFASEQVGKAANLQMARGQVLDAGQLLLDAIADEDPVLFIENKLLYSSKLISPESLPEFDLTLSPLTPNSPSPYAPTYLLSIAGAPAPQLTIVSYGHMAELARQAVLKLAYEDEIFCELVVVTQLAPFVLDAVISSLELTGQLLVAEEGTLTLGWGAEVLARAAEALGERLKSARRVAGRDFPIPASGVLEEVVLPGIDDIVQAARMMV